MRSEVAKYQPQLDVLIGFVEGRLGGAALDAALATAEMKVLLGTFEDARYPARTNHYRRLDKQDRASLGGLVNSEGILEEFLQKTEVSCRPTKRFSTLYSLILKAVPEYLDPPLDFMMEYIVPSDGDLSDAQKKKVITERLMECFKYVDKSPRWIQSPDWPIRDGKPMIFIGQLSINAPDLFHDKGAAYLFYDPQQGRFETVSQFH